MISEMNIHKNDSMISIHTSYNYHFIHVFTCWRLMLQQTDTTGRDKARSRYNSLWKQLRSGYYKLLNKYPSNGCDRHHMQSWDRLNDREKHLNKKHKVGCVFQYHSGLGSKAKDVPRTWKHLPLREQIQCVGGVIRSTGQGAKKHSQQSIVKDSRRGTVPLLWNWKALNCQGDPQTLLSCISLFFQAPVQCSIFTLVVSNNPHIPVIPSWLSRAHCSLYTQGLRPGCSLDAANQYGHNPNTYFSPSWCTSPCMPS